MKNYTYEEAYTSLNISRSNFFSRLNLVRPSLETHITKQENINYISAQGLEILRDYKKLNTEKSDERDQQLQDLQEKIRKMAEETNAAQDAFKEKSYQTCLLEEQLKNKDYQTNFLEEQLREKSENNIFLQEQLKEKDNQLKALSALVENGQILLKQEQEQCRLLAESVSMPEEVIQVPQAIQQKGIWQKIFRK